MTEPELKPWQQEILNKLSMMKDGFKLSFYPGRSEKSYYGTLKESEHTIIHELRNTRK